MEILMKCGHTAQGIISGTKTPICAICNCATPAEQQPDLTGRQAKCVYYGKKSKYHCAGITESRFSLPFFEYRPNDEYDNYYCGCWGWD